MEGKYFASRLLDMKLFIVLIYHLASALTHRCLSKLRLLFHPNYRHTWKRRVTERQIQWCLHHHIAAFLAWVDMTFYCIVYKIMTHFFGFSLMCWLKCLGDSLEHTHCYKCLNFKYILLIATIYCKNLWQCTICSMTVGSFCAKH